MSIKNHLSILRLTELFSGFSTKNCLIFSKRKITLSRNT